MTQTQSNIMIGGGIALLIYALAAARKATSNNNEQITNTDQNMAVNTKLPRGYRNNNPLNIRISSNDWLGKVKPNTDGTFEQFTSMAYGYRAAYILLRTYITKYDCDTIAKIINRWAPENENNTSGYISRVCGTMGVPSTTMINPYNQQQMMSLVFAMSLVENGTRVEPDAAAINEGWYLYQA